MEALLGPAGTKLRPRRVAAVEGRPAALALERRAGRLVPLRRRRRRRLQLGDGRGVLRRSRRAVRPRLR